MACELKSLSVPSHCFSDQLIIEVIEKALSSLGESPKKAVWYCLEKNFKVYRADLPRNIVDFEEALQKIFGLGYSFLETLFRNYLTEATALNFDSCNSFAECVHSLELEIKNV
jgi:hypothetical protein